MTAGDAPAWAVRLRAEREKQLWAVPEMARQLRHAAGGALPDLDSLVRMIKKWEAGKHLPGERYQLLYGRAFGISREHLFGTGAQPAEILAAPLGADEVADFGAWAEATNVGPGTLGYYAGAVNRLAHDYLHQPPDPVRVRAAELTRGVFGLVQNGRQRLDQTRELYGSAAKLCAFTAWACGDLGQMQAADAHARTAMILAEQADLLPVRALAFSVQSKTAFWDKRHTEAAVLARRGYECSPNDTMKVFLACQEADAWQELGDVPRALEALRSVDRARAEIDRDDEVGGLFSCGLARQLNYTMTVRLRAADPAAAIASAEQALEAYRQGEEWAYGTWAQIRVGMAHGYLLLRELEGVNTALAPVLAQPPDLRLATVVTRVAELGRLLAQTRYRDDPLARSLREQIDEYRAGKQAVGRGEGGAGDRVSDA
ncbi:hypothetical protein [Planobispora takensis]|uniref:XRE family transcriptional regulator n=1 Tax=Planobispora takensis TaxID=1367882 RepID=A0A8J3WQV7_9ACTN|nr:hypothetical protein [Planobispora takensis]GIH99184.1 hypothetical protein Pta02_11930 [Planobispora takensis]